MTDKKDVRKLTAASICKELGLPEKIVGKKFLFTYNSEGFLDSGSEAKKTMEKVSVETQFSGKITWARLHYSSGYSGSCVHIILETDKQYKGFPLIIRATYRQKGEEAYWEAGVQMGFVPGGTHKVMTKFGENEVTTSDSIKENFNSGKLEIL